MTINKKKKPLKKGTAISYSKYDFSEPVDYTLTYFGLANEVVNVFTIDLDVAQMKKNFQIFEEIRNVHEWPISKLIQRELDSNRASNICNDYLMMVDDLKYFPPITAVLIPTENANLPTDSYPEINSEDIKALNAMITEPRKEKYADYDSSEVITGGIYKIPYGDQGDIVWDKNIISAVIIDGQHRYKALVEASEKNKKYLQCKVVVNLIDLVPLCKSQKKGPTDIARNLFVTINNTPVDVDEARLVLMDDRDALATFTQVLVDDSDLINKPVAPAELIDWKCEGAKHDIDQSLTGVLTLRQVIQSSMFDNISISSIDDRQNRRKVRKWLDSLEMWLGIDDVINKALGASETMQSKFDLAIQDADDDADESESPFLFSYSGAVAKIVMERFKELYLPVFRNTYHNLSPYKTCHDIASEEGAYDKNSKLHSFLRSFTAKRKELLQDIPTKKEVEKYKKSFKNKTIDSIPHTVMGQKAIFKTLFTYYLNDEEDYDSDELLNISKRFESDFNDAYSLTTPSYNTDENIFNIRFKLKKAVEVSNAGDLGREFWRGIILKHNGEIDYSKPAVDILASVIQDIIDLSLYEDSNEEHEYLNKFEFSKRDNIIKRHQRIIKSFNNELTDDVTKDIAVKIITKKEKLLENIIKK